MTSRQPMNNKKNNYRVSRGDYKIFLDTVLPEARNVVEVKLPTKLITRTLSKTTGECLCERISYKQEGKKEEYYIFRDPPENERRAPIPKAQVEIDDPKVLQKIFDAMGIGHKQPQEENPNAEQ